MTNTPPPSPTPTSRGIWISGLLLGALVGLVPWAIAQFIPRDTADGENQTETASNQAIQSFSTPTTPGTPVLPGPGGTQAPNSTGPGGVQSPNGATSPGITQTVNPQTQTQTQTQAQTQPVNQPTGGVTQIPVNRRVTQSPRPVQRQTTNQPAPTTTGSGASNTGSNRQPIRGLW